MVYEDLHTIATVLKRELQRTLPVRRGENTGKPWWRFSMGYPKEALSNIERLFGGYELSLANGILLQEVVSAICSMLS